MKVINIENKDFVFKLNINQMILWEEISGKSLTNLGDDGMSIKDMRTMFHSGLVGGGAKHDAERSGDLMTSYIEESGMDEFTALLEDEMVSLMGNQKMKANLKKVTKK